MNGDGKLDILIGGGVELWVLLGDGGGTFGRLLRSTTNAPSPRPPVVVDVNRDGKPDAGDGSFRPATIFPISGGFAANGLASGDFNGDGNVDLAATNPGAPDLFQGSTVSVLLGRGDGTFGPPTDFQVGTTPLSVVATDFNRDGNVDLAVNNYAGSTVSVLLGQGDGTFLPKTDYATGPFTSAIASADLNGDSQADLAVCGPPAALTVLAGRADGAFGARQDFDDATDCTSIAVGDFNLDGRPDLALNYFAGSGTVSIFLNKAAPADTTPPAITVSATPSILWPPNGKTTSVVVTGTMSDGGSGVDISSGHFVVTDEYGIVQPAGSVSIAADGTYSVAVPLAASRRGDDLDGRKYVIGISAKDRVGNIGSASTIVIVPHDHRSTASPRVDPP